tara:strand:- start:16 stop:354 length:339 start_codon:yes stop_codon:yes gene_type:complete
MKLWNKNICLTSPVSVMIIISLMFSTLVIASSVIYKEKVVKVETVEEMWIPTKEDIAYQDSMYSIIQNTQNDITDIKQDIVYILERLDYEDGTWDSIRYVKGGKIDKRRNKN